MAPRRQKRSQTASRHEISGTEESILTVLDDALLAHIISFVRPRLRSQLRVVCKRTKALVDQQVTELEIDLTKFPKKNPLFIKRAALLWPGIRSVELVPDHDPKFDISAIRALASCDWPNLEKIEIGGYYPSGNDCARVLAKSKGWPALRELHFCHKVYQGGLSLGGVKALSKGLYWANLEVLAIGNQPLRHNGGVLLAELSHAMPALRSLTLLYSEMSAAQLKDFCQGSWQSLEILDLKYNDIGPEGGAIFAEASQRWGKLRELDISQVLFVPHNGLATSGLEHLLSGSWPCLEYLGLKSNKLDARSGTILAEASHRLPSLRKLAIKNNEYIFDKGICALLEGHWPLLEILDIAYCRGRRGALTAFAAASSRCPKISELRFKYFVCRHQIDSHGVQTLRAGTWESVTTLDLSRCKIEDDALYADVSSCFPNLKELCLKGCDLRDCGLKAFLLGLCKGLEILDLSNNRLGHDGAAFLAEASRNNLGKIKSLDLKYNVQLKDAGIKALMEGSWGNMESLVLWRTGYMPSRGAKVVAAAASRLRNLRRLSVQSGHSINKTGCLALAKADWSAMEVITVFREGVSDGDTIIIKELEAAASQNGVKMEFDGVYKHQYEYEYYEYCEDEEEDEGEETF